jgi:cupin fold WbuC family metalloprotein
MNSSSSTRSTGSSMRKFGFERSPYVWYAHDSAQFFNLPEIAKVLLDCASTNPKGVARLCMHQSEQDAAQVMIIALAPLTNFPIHRHIKCSEFLLHISGSGQVTKLENKNPSNIQSSIRFENQIAVPVAPGEWHGIESHEQGVVFVEARPGPFNPLDTEFLFSGK